VKLSEKKDFVQKMKSDFDTSKSIIVAHYSGLSVSETDSIRKEMRNNGAKFRVTKNRLTKLALAETQFKDIADLFSGSTAIAYSEDPVAAAKVAVNFEKKYENFKIVGGGYDGEKIPLDKINFLATLPSLEEVRAQIISLIMSPAQKIATIIKEPANQLARLVNTKSQQGEKSN
jgi:large subunit ribosomal protein L10|tara:strand:+ start:239 stop:760 length:522 start_codon:yes stop_codon:yes gene_type:complete